MNSGGPFLQCFKRTVHVIERLRLLEIGDRADAGVLSAQIEGTVEGAMEVMIKFYGRRATAEYLYRLADETAAPTPQQEKQDGKTKGL